MTHPTFIPGQNTQWSESTTQSLIDFDPNDSKKTPWASYCPRRSPAFKTHSSRGHALAAIHNQRGGSLYRYTEQRAWEHVTSLYPSGLPECQNCGADTTSQVTSSRLQKTGPGQYTRIPTGTTTQAIAGEWRLRRNPANGKIAAEAEFVWLCAPCCKLPEFYTG